MNRASALNDHELDELRHGLANSLAAISGFAELLLMRSHDAAQRAALEHILGAAGKVTAGLQDVFTHLGAASPGAGPLANGGARRSSLLDVDADAPTPTRTVRIVVADDDGSLRSLLRMTLPADGVEIVEAGDGQEAIDLVAAERPDLLLLDWKMPGRSGAEVLEDVRASHPDLPVIVLTAETTETVRTAATLLGATTFLTKPFSPRELLATAERLLPDVTLQG